MIVDEVPQRVQAAFNRAAPSYDQHNSLQATVAQALMAQLQRYCNGADVVVDLGCGSGDSTLLLLETIPCQQIVAIDIADKLLERARHKLSDRGVKVCFGNFNHALFAPASVNLFIANMSLQWSVDLRWTLKRLYSQMAPGALLAFTLPVAGTFIELHRRYRNRFDHYQQVYTLLEQEQFTLLAAHQDAYYRQFDSPLQALQSIKRVGANCVLQRRSHSGLSGKRTLKQMFQHSDRNNTYGLTYAMAFFVGQR